MFDERPGLSPDGAGLLPLVNRACWRCAPGTLVFLFAFAACGDSPSAPIDAAALEGEWTFLFEEAEPDCTPETGGTFELAIRIDHTLTDLLSGEVHVTGRWHPPTDQEAWSLVEGSFHPDPGVFDLTLWGPQRFEGAPRILVMGDIDEGPGVTGEWWEVDGDVLYAGGCSGTVSGQRNP